MSQAPTMGPALDNNSLIANDAILPSQFADLISRSTEGSPEHLLFLTVLEDALRCWLCSSALGGWNRNNRETYHAWASSKRIRLHNEADRWLFGHYSAPLTFAAVCAVLDINADWIRSELKKLSN
jgi:hypothetical protein